MTPAPGNRPRRAPTAPFLAALLAVATLLSACRPGSESPGRESLAPGTPIVLISVDTLRSDRLPAYGYDGVETPALDRLRADSILFRHAYSPVPLTLPAHASMLSGLLPPEHGVRDNVGYRFDPEKHFYLPRELAALDYRTGAFVSSFVMRGASGLADGFELYDDQIASAGLDVDMGGAQRSGAETLERALEWLEELPTADGGRAEPFFLFFHLYEPHTPYAPPEPWRSRYASPYDGEVAAADAYVGSLLDALRELDLYNRALIVFTSDHGESLGEHGYLEHGPFLYREAIQVPLLLKLPGSRRAGETVTAAAQLTDLAPTLLAALGRELPPELGGSSLLALPAERRLFAETVYPRLHFGWSDLASIIQYPHHYIHGPDPELYDLATDPGETRNLLRERRPVATELRREVDRYDRNLRPPDQEDLETLDKLAALGYIGSSIVTDGTELPDPKSRIHLLGRMSDAVLAARAGRHTQAAAIYREVISEEPNMVEAWQNLGASLMVLGRRQEAADAYLEAVRLTGGAPHLALGAAGALLAVNRLDEARAHAELAVGIHPTAHDLLAQIALRQNDLDEAERQLEQVQAAGGKRVGPFITEAQLRLAQERFEEAVAATRRAEENLGDGPRRYLRGAFLVRGDALAALDRVDEAAAAYAAEIDIAPGELAAYARLAFVQAVKGDGAAVGETLRLLVETNPRPEAYMAAVIVLRRIGDPDSAAGLLRQARSRWPEDTVLRELARQ